MGILSDISATRADCDSIKASSLVLKDLVSQINIKLKDLDVIANNNIQMVALLSSIDASLKKLLEPPVTGIGVIPGTPTDRPPKKESTMSVKLIKRSKLFKSAKPHVGAGGPADFILVDNQDDTFTVQGVDAAGNPVDISAVATISVTSSDPTILTVDPPTGMTSAMHTTGKLSTPGTPVNLTVVATWNDGSVGPFTFVLPIDVVAGAAGGVEIVPGTPTSR